MAYEQNYAVVDGTLKNFVEDIAASFDSLSSSAEDKKSITQSILDPVSNNESDIPEKVFTAIAEKSVVIASATEKDFEPLYNQVIHILTFSQNLSEIIPILVKNLASPPKYPNGPILSLAVLSNIFNSLPVTSPLRCQVFSSILDSADASDNFSIIVPQLKNLPTWVKEWGIDAKTIEKLNLKIGNIISKHDPKTAHKYLVAAVSSNDSPDNSLVEQLIFSTLRTSYDFDDIFALEAVQTQSKSNPTLYKLLEIVSNGDYPAFKQFGATNSSFLTKTDLDTLTRRVRILALTKAASQYGEKVIPYTVLAKASDVSTEEVEFWIIDAIRAGLIEGRLSQLSQSMSLHRASPVGKFGAEEWAFVAEKLANWKSSLKEISDVLKVSRENAQKEEEKLAKAKAQQSVQSA